ncbi:transmembrane protein 241 isoform X2 [Betta splendens]|uniref:Transmembrane protein 241 isoform X2 n=1 Tax=Betta splendens TaxID=158456 RepID=A0A9W2XQV9_BETSP|nr:transmembrane protein 241 isoform X2 [Betta splendens]
MQWRRHVTGCAFCFVFVLSNFTNKFVLSVLNFTYPTLFQGWQTLIGAVLLLLFAKLGWVEISRITRSAALSWLPASLLFVGNIYAGSKALSRIVRHNCTGSLTPDTDSFMSTGGVSPLAAGHSFLLHSSEFLSRGQLRYAEGGAEREDPVAQADQVRSFSSLLRIVMWFHTCFALITSSVCLMLVSAANLLYSDPQLDHSGSMWAVFHLVCVGAYRVFQVHHRSSTLSDLEQQCINYVFSVLLLAAAAHPTGDLVGVLEFPSLQSHIFHCGCAASAALGFLLLLATVKLKTGPSLEHVGIWMFFSKVISNFLSKFSLKTVELRVFYIAFSQVTAICLSPFIFNMDINAASLICVVISHAGEALLMYSERESP